MLAWKEMCGETFGEKKSWMEKSGDGCLFERVGEEATSPPKHGREVVGLEKSSDQEIQCPPVGKRHCEVSGAGPLSHAGKENRDNGGGSKQNCHHVLSNV